MENTFWFKLGIKVTEIEGNKQKYECINSKQFPSMTLK